MKTLPHVLAESHYLRVKDASFEIAILPWGATEAHNFHLPYGTDIIESDHVAAESARLANEQGARVVVLPTVPYGVNTRQLDIPLTINMNPSTQMANPREWLAQMPAFNKAFPGLNIPNFGAKGFDPTSLAQNPLQFWMTVHNSEIVIAQ